MKKIEIEGLVTKIIGSEIFYYKEIDSTQKEIWRRLEQGNIKNGTIIMADIQTAGIGTHGRTWHTSSRGNIAFSFVFFPNCKAKKLENVTTEIAKTFVDIFRDFYNIKVEIKSPNDLIVHNKKIGGILTETKLSGEKVKEIVIGVGINTKKEKFEEDIKEIASSISKEYGIKVDNKRIIKEFCNRFERYLLKEKIGQIEKNIK